MESTFNSKEIEAIAFDLDGTIYFGDNLADKVFELLDLLKEKNIKIFYFTNNSTKSRNQIYSKLSSLGINLDLSEVYTSSYAAAIYAKSCNFKKVFCCGSENLKEQFLEEGIKIEDEVVDAVFIGLDSEFNYNKLSKALSLLVSNPNSKLIACNIDRNYPIEGGILMPGCGPIVSAIETCANRNVDFIVGKPNHYMLELLIEDHAIINKDNLLIVGDTYDSDILMAKSYGCPSVLISSKDHKDTIVIKKLSDLLDLFQNPLSKATERLVRCSDPHVPCVHSGPALRSALHLPLKGGFERGLLNNLNFYGN